MKLRTQLIALSLLTLLLPWSGWKLLQELERFLRESQESALLASARTLAGALPMEFQTRLLFLPETYLPLRTFARPPVLDGYSDDWPGAAHALRFESGDGRLGVGLIGGEYGDRLYLSFDVRDENATLKTPQRVVEDGIILLVRNPRGLSRYTITPAAPGPIQLRPDRPDSGQLEGYWQDHETGYRLEVALPSGASDTEISFQVRDALPGDPAGGFRAAGPGVGDGSTNWISVSGEWRELSGWLARSGLASSRTWLVDDQGWILADSASVAAPPVEAARAGQGTTWLQRLLYRLVAGSRTELLEEAPSEPVRLSDPLVDRALAGEEAVRWTQDLETASVWNTVATPVRLENRVAGAVVVQAASDGLLLVTSRALGRLLFTTLALTFGLAAGLWYFASRLSRRVRRLSSAVDQAMEDSSAPGPIPLRDDRDELGDLARNNEKLLRAVADYSQYLQTLAGKLSHELKTPLAITRSSLDNLASQPLDAEAHRFVERAREGVERQAAIVRAMSEASRLEASIGVAEWTEIDLRELVDRCAEGYRAIHPGRRLETRLPGAEARIRCAPDLLAQALDKLVDNAVTLSGEADLVTLSLEAGDAAWKLSVRNSGSRLPDDLAERLFDSLVSLRERRGSTPHLGLGLYIVRLVAAAHDGEVSARNLPERKGVEFTIRLPIGN
jgi:dedicated sortase system histidine kinase